VKVGDLVKSIHTGEVFIITELDGDLSFSLDSDTSTADNSVGYVVASNGKQFLMPMDHLEVISESR
jgi:hypothetical protein